MFANLSYLDPQIEVLAESPRRDMLMARLTANGFRPIKADRATLATGRLPLLIDGKSADPGLVAEAQSGADRLLILLGAGAMAKAGSANTLTLADEAGLKGLRAHLDLRQRQALCESERTLRAATQTALLGHGAPQEMVPARKLLFFGAPTADFAPLKRAFEHQQIEVAAAYTLPTALSYMRDEGFTACLVDMASIDDATLARFAGEDWSGQVIAMAAPERALDAAVLDFILDASLDVEAIAHAVAGLLDRPALSSRVAKPKLTDTLHDVATGLYSAGFLRAHLPEQIKADSDTDWPLSLLCLRARHSDRQCETDIIDTIAPLVAAGLRESDVACRYEAGAILISLRAAGYGHATSIAGRLISRIERQMPDAVPHLHWRAVEHRDYHTADMLIQSAMSGPFARPVAA